MMLRIDAGLALPVYEQIREQVVRMVMAGTLEPGTRMPTIRQLANDLHLAKGTVAKAYSLLEEHRVLETRGHRGSFVLDPAGITFDTGSPDVALAESADAYVIAARQLGVDVEAAVDAVRRRWSKL